MPAEKSKNSLPSTSSIDNAATAFRNQRVRTCVKKAEINLIVARDERAGHCRARNLGLAWDRLVRVLVVMESSGSSLSSRFLVLSEFHGSPVRAVRR